MNCVIHVIEVVQHLAANEKGHLRRAISAVEFAVPEMFNGFFGEITNFVSCIRAIALANVPRDIGRGVEFWN